MSEDENQAPPQNKPQAQEKGPEEKTAQAPPAQPRSNPQQQASASRKQPPKKRPPQQKSSQQKPPQQKAGMFEEFDFNTTIQQLWHGNIPLVQTFWFYYFGVIFILHFLSNVVPGFSLIELVWAGFMVKPIFVAAEEYKGPAYWALAAKVGAVLIGLSVLGDLLFY